MARLKGRHQGGKYEKILKKKRDTDVQTLCRDLPPEFSLYFTYVRSLQFEERPDYAYLRKIFHEVFVRNNFKRDDEYDWVPIMKERENAAQLQAGTAAEEPTDKAGPAPAEPAAGPSAFQKFTK